MLPCIAGRYINAVNAVDTSARLAECKATDSNGPTDVGHIPYVTYMMLD